jgi:hypothetical protein
MEELPQIIRRRLYAVPFGRASGTNKISGFSSALIIYAAIVRPAIIRPIHTQILRADTGRIAVYMGRIGIVAIANHPVASNSVTINVGAIIGARVYRQLNRGPIRIVLIHMNTIHGIV